MLTKFLNKNTNSKVAIEYVAPHFVVLIQNPGQRGWVSLQSTKKNVQIPNRFGDIVKTIRAIESFPTRALAEAWVKEHMPEAELVARSNADIEKFLTNATSATSGFEI